MPSLLRTLAHGVLLVAVTTLPLLAQEQGRIPRGRRGPGGQSQAGGVTADEPDNWVSLSLAFQSSPLVRDGATRSAWDFGSGFPLRASIERRVGSDATIGVVGSYARMPLVYAGPAGSGCEPCDAHAAVVTYGAAAHVGGGLGYYNVFDLFIGAIQYGNFERDDDKTKLAPSSPNIDFAFSPGYGFGYGFARDWKGEFVANYLYSVHERKDLPNNAQVLAGHLVLRATIRVGF